MKGRRPEVLRLIDANANRAVEGLRVCEEIVRLYLEWPQAFRRLRRLRHAVAQAVRSLPLAPSELLRARASGRDVGRRAAASGVKSLEQLLLINLQRAKESLRTLEECARLLSPPRATTFQRLRFATYGVERDLLCRLATVRHR